MPAAAAVKPKRPRAWGLPLLTKELVEQSARKRTYVIRTLYACLLFGFATLIFWSIVYDNLTSPWDVLGQGREMFLAVLALQFGGVYLFMPAITAGVITSEKERNSLGLLLLTRLGPSTILLEKLAGRLVTMGTFLLLSLPLLSFAYAFGGVTQRELWTGVWALVITALQVGALALACSAFFRTTVQAFIATYVIGFLMYFGPMIAGEMYRPLMDFYAGLAQVYNHLFTSWAGVIYAAWARIVHGELASIGPLEPLDFHQHEFPGLFFPPLMLIERWNLSLWHIIPRSLPTLVSVVFFLVVARVFVVRRAFVPARNRFLRFLLWLDTLFHRINQNRVTKGIVLINESTTLPDDDPVAWRETKKKSLGTTRYLIRIFLATEVPVLILCLLMALSINTGYGSWSSGYNEPVAVLLMVAWIFVALLVCVRAASLISGERSHETLDVLLSTPLRCSDLVRQKFQGVRRLMLVLAVPLLTMIAFQTFWRLSIRPPFSNLNEKDNPLLYLTSAVLCVVVYLPLVAWVSFHVGLRVRSQTRAILGALALIVGWSAVPLILVMTFSEVFRWHLHGGSPLSYAFLLSPVSMIPMTEFCALDEIDRNSLWLPVFLNFLYYGGILLFLRRRTLRSAALYLGRAEAAHAPSLRRSALLAPPSSAPA